MSKSLRKTIRYSLSWLIILGALLYWYFQSDPETIWTVIVIAIVVAAGSSAFGEDRFGEALEVARSLSRTEAEPQQSAGAGGQSEAEPQQSAGAGGQSEAEPQQSAGAGGQSEAEPQQSAGAGDQSEAGGSDERENERAGEARVSGGGTGAGETAPGVST